MTPINWNGGCSRQFSARCLDSFTQVAFKTYFRACCFATEKKEPSFHRGGDSSLLLSSRCG
eukprot:CAMPEP_0179339910 /NCGR_PEP_ID=MMETSP0797-20121207/68983_1 /TAXON_ID=47934 /ORGANISM="Dinophysis acuminata, Strain DAEP01" /LENGTH=60 /DNA_ID=CAMNT_0021053805 /DNA_START=66 /DNA_END=245 /DNA_ORIENTATION=+